MINLAFFILIPLIISSISKSIMDVLNFKFSSSIFSLLRDDKIRNWFNPTESWKNKYKDKDVLKGPAFFGSTTIFVWTTDAWHFFQSLMLLGFELSITLSIAFLLNFSFFNFLCLLSLIKMLRGVIFEVFFKIFLKKDIYKK